MSGGHFNYVQWRLTEVSQEIEDRIENNGSERRDDWNDLLYDDLSSESLTRFKLASRLTQLAQKAITKVDWLLSGDDNEESFQQRWDKEIGSIDEIVKFLKEGE